MAPAPELLLPNSSESSTYNFSLHYPTPTEAWWIHTAQCWAVMVAMMGVGGNLLTIFTIVHQLYLGHVWRRRHRAIYHRGRGRLPERMARPVLPLEGDTLLLLHLSFCDFIYCIVNLPLTAFTYHFAFTNDRPEKSFCKGAAFFRYCSALVEWLTLGVLAMERCVDLGRSRSDRVFKPLLAVCSMAVIWTVSLSLHFLLMKSDFDYVESMYKCDIAEEEIILVFYSVETWVPCALMLSGCISIIFQLWKHLKKLKNAGMPDDITKKRCQDMAKSTILVLSLLLLFLLCVLPISVYNISVSLGARENVPLSIAIYMVYWIQYGINYLVYAASSTNYKKAYVQFFKAMRNTFCVKRKEEEVNVNVFLTATHPHLMSTFSHLLPTLSHLHTVTAVPLHAYHIPQRRLLRSHSLNPDTHNKSSASKGRKSRAVSSVSLHSWNSLLHWSDSVSSRSSVVTMETNLGAY